jgi:hypothetical protein
MGGLKLLCKGYRISRALILFPTVNHMTPGNVTNGFGHADAMKLEALAASLLPRSSCVAAMCGWTITLDLSPSCWMQSRLDS